jgi:uncharacterized repeat protein (TIGR01451 family)
MRPPGRLLRLLKLGGLALVAAVGLLLAPASTVDNDAAAQADDVLLGPMYGKTFNMVARAPKQVCQQASGLVTEIEWSDSRATNEGLLSLALVAKTGAIPLTISTAADCTWAAVGADFTVPTSGLYDVEFTMDVSGALVLNGLTELGCDAERAGVQLFAFLWDQETGEVVASSPVDLPGMEKPTLDHDGCSEQEAVAEFSALFAEAVEKTDKVLELGGRAMSLKQLGHAGAAVTDDSFLWQAPGWPQVREISEQGYEFSFEEAVDLDSGKKYGVGVGVFGFVLSLTSAGTGAGYAAALFEAGSYELYDWPSNFKAEVEPTRLSGIRISLAGAEDSDDSDHDGVSDPDDECPDEAEDKDGFRDSDGCPDPDNDNDDIPDTSDECPDDAEDYNGYEDEDGCPDGPTVTPSPGADLFLTKLDSPDPVASGDNITYSLVVANVGSASAADARVDDELPPDVTFVSASPGCIRDVGVRCNIGTLGPGETVSFTITVTAPTATSETSVRNCAVAHASNEANTANNDQCQWTGVNPAPTQPPTQEPPTQEPPPPCLVAPSNLSANRSWSGGAAWVDLHWTDNSDDEEGFRVERATSAEGPYTVIVTMSQNSTEWTDYALAYGPDYYYRIIGYKQGCDSERSNVATVSGRWPTPSPVPVCAAIEAPSDLTVARQYPWDGRSFVDLRWQDNSAEETGFAVQRAAAPEGPWGHVASVKRNKTEFTDEPPLGPNIWYYRVLAVGVELCYSEPSNIVTALGRYATPTAVP